MRTIYGVSGRSRARVSTESSFSGGLEWAVAANRDLLSGAGLNLTAGQGNGAQLQQITNPWSGVPNFGLLQPSASHYGPATVRRRTNYMNGGASAGSAPPGWSVVWGMYIDTLANGYILGVMINDSSAMNTSSQSGNWRLWTQNNGSLNLEMVYYNNPVSWAATNVSAANFYKTGWHTYGISRVSTTQFDFYCDGDYVSSASSADGGFGGPNLYMGALSEGSLGFHCHGAVHANNTYSLGNTMVFAYGWSRSYDRAMMQRLTYEPGAVLGATSRHGVLSAGSVTHSMAATVSAAASATATARKRSRVSAAASTATTTTAVTNLRRRMAASPSAEASVDALLTARRGVEASVAAAAYATATASVRQAVAKIVLTSPDPSGVDIHSILSDLGGDPAKINDPGGANDDFLQRKSDGWTNRTVAQVKADLGLGAPVAIEHFYEDNIYSGLQGLNHATLSGGGSGQVYGQNLLVLWRIMPVMDVDIDGFLLQVQVDGGSGALARVGIFAQDPTSAPTGAPLLDSGDIGVNVSVGNQVSGTTSSAHLSAWTPYWGAFVTNSASLSIRWMAAGANNNVRVSSIDAGQSSSLSHTLRRVAHTFGALPTSPAAAFTTAYPDIPGVLWRVQV